MTVVIPTIGRERLLEAAIGSIRACRPRPAEVLIVDQSGAADVEARCAALGYDRLRVVPCAGRGIALATNTGLRAARHATVLVTHDDCTVAADWVGVAWAAMAQAPDGLVTGKVLPVGDPRATPSIRVSDAERDYTGTVAFNALYPANMVINRDRAAALGGFDERDGLRLAAEDNDFCYRWLDAGHELRYLPSLVVWHHDWRSPTELSATYVTYARGQGVFYAKHLAAGDRRIVRFVLYDLYLGLRSYPEAILFRIPRSTDWRRGILRGLPRGLIEGWSETRALRAGRAPHAR